MKKIFTLIFVAITIIGCKQEDNKETKTNEQAEDIAYASFGEKIDDKNVVPAVIMAKKYDAMEVNDTTTVKVMAKVNEVCQAKGCWMKVDLENGQQAMVKFKDYGFFMPKDIAGKEVIISGKAFVNKVPVDEQRHYASDSGASDEEIAAITEPKTTYSFEADGVLLKRD